MTTIIHYGNGCVSLHDVTCAGPYNCRDNCVCDYAIGYTEPRHPMPTIMQGSYVLASTITDDNKLLVIWFADGTTIAF